MRLQSTQEFRGVHNRLCRSDKHVCKLACRKLFVRLIVAAKHLRIFRVFRRPPMMWLPASATSASRFRRLLCKSVSLSGKWTTGRTNFRGRTMQPCSHVERARDITREERAVQESVGQILKLRWIDTKAEASQSSLSGLRQPGMGTQCVCGAAPRQGEQARRRRSEDDREHGRGSRTVSPTRPVQVRRKSKG